MIKPPLNCRQRMKAEGKHYPRSNCASCGSLAPNSKACDDALKSEPMTISMAREPEVFRVGPLTLARVFQKNCITNLSNLQLVLDAVEDALQRAIGIKLAPGSLAEFASKMVEELAPDQGQIPSPAFSMALSLQAALASQPLSNPQQLEGRERSQILTAYRNLDASADKDAVIAHLCDLLEAPKVEQEPVANPLVFGLGALVVDHGKYGGEPAVFVAKAKAAGRVGELTGRDYFDRESLQPGELVLQFPTDTQAKSVADALVGSPAPASELLEAMEAIAEEFEHAPDDKDKFGYPIQSPSIYAAWQVVRGFLDKHKGPQS